MAKIIAPFEIIGTLDDINFYKSQDGNIARLKGNTGVTSKEFKNNPIFDRIRNQATEFGQCSKRSVHFRQLASRFNHLAKDGSFAGRVNKLLFEILEEDTTQPQGKRTLTEGLKTEEGKKALWGFESNKLRPLRKVLLIQETWNQENQTLTISDFIAAEQLDWPQEATHVHLAIATANWDFENHLFDSCYSNEIILNKESEKQTLTLTTETPKGNHLLLSFLFIGFAKQDRKKYKFLHRKNNTATIIASHTP